MTRICAWCDSDISGTGEAHPIMYARVDGESDNWQCSDYLGCDQRQEKLSRRLGTPRIASYLRVPLVALSAGVGR